MNPWACIAIIPARFASTRFPGKLLASLAGRPFIQHVIEAVLRVPAIDGVVLATDDERVAEAARATGIDVLLSSRDCATGTDRVAAAASEYEADMIVNVQGDELLLDPEAVSAAVERFREDEVGLGTLRTRLTEPEDMWDPNVVKVAIDANERALYFSRGPLPFPRGQWQALVGGDDEPERGDATARMIGRLAAGAEAPRDAWVHVGVYLYTPEALDRWAALPPSRLERSEGLEQLRVLEAGEPMQTYLINETVPGVNTPGDLDRVRAALTERTPNA